MILIAIAIKGLDGGDIFYSGVRYGYKKKTFTMYKFRTLVPNAEEMIGARLLKPGEGLETKIGKFLRETRLDELPQLFNIINGSMTFIGPRPERPAVYERMCKTIKGYDKRFDVKPGVFGFSQLFTPHGTDKRMRAFIDSYYSKKRDFFYETELVIYSFLVLGIALHKKAFQRVYSKARLLIFGKKVSSQRRFVRKSFNNNSNRVSVELWYSVADDINKVEARVGLRHSDIEATIININDEAMLVSTDQPISTAHIDDNHLIKIRIKTGKSNKLTGKCKFKIIYCTLVESALVGCTRVANYHRYNYLFTYKGISSLNEYKIDKYILNKCAA